MNHEKLNLKMEAMEKRIHKIRDAYKEIQNTFESIAFTCRSYCKTKQDILIPF